MHPKGYSTLTITVACNIQALNENDLVDSRSIDCDLYACVQVFDYKNFTLQHLATSVNICL